MPFVAGGVLAGVVCFVCAEWLSVDGVGIASGQKDFVLSVWDSLCRSWLLVKDNASVSEGLAILQAFGVMRRVVEKWSLVTGWRTVVCVVL